MIHLHFCQNYNFSLLLVLFSSLFCSQFFRKVTHLFSLQSTISPRKQKFSAISQTMRYMIKVPNQKLKISMQTSTRLKPPRASSTKNEITNIQREPMAWCIFTHGVLFIGVFEWFFFFFSEWIILVHLHVLTHFIQRRLSLMNHMAALPPLKDWLLNEWGLGAYHWLEIWELNCATHGPVATFLQNYTL